jgi:hypothetical protein
VYDYLSRQYGLEAGVPEEVTATGPSSQTALPLDPSAAPQTCIRARRMP